jgi:hypothetical protein
MTGYRDTMLGLEYTMLALLSKYFILILIFSAEYKMEWPKIYITLP